MQLKLKYWKWSEGDNGLISVVFGLYAVSDVRFYIICIPIRQLKQLSLGWVYKHRAWPDMMWIERRIEGTTSLPRTKMRAGRSPSATRKKGAVKLASLGRKGNVNPVSTKAGPSKAVKIVKKWCLLSNVFLDWGWAVLVITDSRIATERFLICAILGKAVLDHHGLERVLGSGRLDQIWFVCN